MWFFAYGSLIWKPACAFVEIRTGVVRGWHRAFCLGWNTRFRGSEAFPGLMLALDNGGACKGVAYRLPPDAIDEQQISEQLSTRGMPDPDLIIRTSGEWRLSNFLIWQAAYSEYWTTPMFWPDFGPEQLRQAIQDYGQRERRFGGLSNE